MRRYSSRTPSSTCSPHLSPPSHENDPYGDASTSAELLRCWKDISEWSEGMVGVQNAQRPPCPEGSRDLSYQYREALKKYFPSYSSRVKYMTSFSISYYLAIRLFKTLTYTALLADRIIRRQESSHVHARPEAFTATSTTRLSLQILISYCTSKHRPLSIDP